MGQRNSWGSQRLQQKNIYNDPLEVCSLDPITGWYRDGYARTDNNDRGLHVVLTRPGYPGILVRFSY